MTRAFRTDPHMFDVIEDEGSICAPRLLIEVEDSVDQGTRRVGGCCGGKIVPVPLNIEDEGLIS
ncbi:hypothetical protein [Parvularcula sp. LCG005]|uniref:hypothetical protein n=1 Tax=Parvularcula sp. LCG005 TaxID=3078805 RepID=UPI002942E489|nr:hypothetical protein [Parvularcula sp. LCG005]WOI54296.1 hypothetical protein RUI03_04670 [Parvularcula sp. LCG005]